MLCKDNNCKKHASFNFENEQKALFCSAHKHNGMINIKKKCKLCSTYALYNYSNEKTPKFCSKHKKDNMINITKKCNKCSRYALYNFPNKKTPKFCSDHREDGMINIRKKCKFCPKYATFNFSTKTKPLYCYDHKKDNMIDLSHRKCVKCDINRRNYNLDSYCTPCFKYYFPEDERTKRLIRKEYIIRNDIIQKYSYLNFEYDKKLSCQSCNLSRPDIFLDCYHYTIIIEIDEFQHKYGYDDSCEHKRMMEIFETLGKRPIIFLRFNPDKNNTSLGMFTKNILKTEEYNIRFNKLCNILDECLKNGTKKEVDIRYLFYDSEN